ncbi:NUDIX hydrolase [Actinokineospora bangkokensis]|uniref:NUDIX hydrolase n=1 Tax=Actinokineospora bangkokensis TaxID=1193682 RepID=A0A1Q9LGQ1_9PSEU|nr:NUDIX hydrolase [Actinokineospora bangkokensis]OLR91222.1 NUDIX hydrolase [Actinokineospora bangkokensis]
MVLPGEFVPEAGSGPPVVARDAATVMLVRDVGGGVEVFLLRRVVGMAFAGGMTVFPGGGVDKRDLDASVAWHGPSAGWWGERFGCSESLARALVCAAVRETFEESGVLLAGPDGGSVVSDTGPYRGARQALVDREYSFAEFLQRNGLVLRADLLRPWANWVTPEAEPRRYDTRFFLAAMPEGQLADGATTEADDAGWQRPAEAIADWQRGARGLMPPTWTALAELGERGSVAELMGVERSVEKVIPKVVRDGNVLRVILPSDPAYADAPFSVDPAPGDEVRP